MKVSVIIPTFNRAGFVEHAVTSVVRQSYNDIETIIVDDGSTDDTASIVGRLQEKTSRPIIYRHTSNRGCASARNLGLEIATGTGIAFKYRLAFYAKLSGLFL